jgi:H+-transporting ATPase
MEDVISKVVKWLLFMVGISLAVTAAVSFFMGTDLLQILPIVLILLVSAIPVALPAMFTISMALGSLELSRNGVLVTRLNASEDAATMDIACVDKTGTLTMNRLAVAKVMPYGNFERKDVILYGALASQKANEDPIDRAFITAAKLEYVEDGSFVQKLFVPFDPSTRKTEAVIEADRVKFKVMKGAVKTVGESCGLSSDSLSELELSTEDFARKGYRTLAVARAVDEGRYVLVGLAALSDEPRPESAALVRELKSLGISVKMLTGDSLPVAKEIAEEVGIGNSIIRASDLGESINQNAIEATQLAEKSAGFAEIYPEDKYTIVKSLQVSKHVVGMTGDGVNDAPALKQAEVGIAVSSATDVAKGAASVVLTSEGLSNIVDLVKIGRMIYQRIRTWIINKVVKSFLVIMFVVLAFLMTGLYVVTTFHIVLLLFVIDFVTITLSTDHVRGSEKPNTWDVTGLMKVGAVVGLLAVLESLGLLAFGSICFDVLADADKLHTFSFLTLFYFSIFTIFVVRERGHFWDSRPSRILLTVTILDMAIVTLIGLFGVPNVQPIAPIEVATVMVLSFVSVMFLNDTVKALLMKRMRE